MHSEALLPPTDFASLSAQDKFDSIIDRMNCIFELERHRFWRDRFATPEQFAVEYPESYAKDLAIAFRLIKQNYNDYFEEINDIAQQIGDNDYFRILKNIVEQDIEDVLLGANDEREEV